MKFEKKHLKVGCVCPFCGSEHIEGQSVDIEGPAAKQECSCHTCGKEWLDEYVLCRVIDLSSPEEPG